MKEISVAAGLNVVYKNHPVCGTTAKAMREGDNPVQDIQFVLKQKNLQSIVSYLDAPDQSKKEKFSKDIFCYTGGAESDSDDSHLDDFQPPQPPPKKSYTGKGKGKGKLTKQVAAQESPVTEKNGMNLEDHLMKMQLQHHHKIM